MMPAAGRRSYAAYYITRGSLTYVAPLMMADPQLGLTLPQVWAAPALDRGPLAGQPCCAKNRGGLQAGSIGSTGSPKAAGGGRRQVGRCG
jgi:hypothetical protein